MTDQRAPLLEVRDLHVGVDDQGTEVAIVDGISFSVSAGETIGIVGESGSGKTMTAMAIMGLLGPGVSARGEVRLAEEDLLTVPSRRLEQLRGSRLAMIFQDPMTSLNPAFTVGAQIAEVVRLHSRLGRRQARARAVELLDRVGIADASRRARAYPHEFSGGMRQRVLIAMAISCEPALLIADEPTTALDVTVQEQVLDLLRSLRDSLGMAMIFVTHDLGVVAEMCDRVLVLYAGEVVEQADVVGAFHQPQHPYTSALVGSLPQLSDRGSPLRIIAGAPPRPGTWALGCRFGARCDHATAACLEAPVPLVATASGQSVRCRRAAELELHGVSAEAARP